jgi:uncharacterized protein YecE (DUF72 family)
LKSWAGQVPSTFTFALKASRYLTHLKRLRDPEAPLALFFDRARVLGQRLGPVLYQLPPTLAFDAERLQHFLQALPVTLAATIPSVAGSVAARALDRLRIRHVIEFRHPSWYREDVFAQLRAFGVALCLHDRLGSEISDPLVGPFVYVRFHGPSGRYHGSYTKPMLAQWAERLKTSIAAGTDVYAYFNNDIGGAATKDAHVLRDLIDARKPTTESRPTQ